MATNKFATLIHRKTNRITLILIYVFLEWSLIFFILVNSLFNYFIRRFADYFGLKRPCLFCSRLDRFFDDSGKSPSNRDLLCDDHVLEISKVGFSYSYSKPVDESNVDFGESHKDLVHLRCCEEKTSSSIVSDFGILSRSIGDEGQICNGVKFSNDSQEETEEKKFSSENTVIEIVPQFPGKIEEEEATVDDDDEFSCYISSFDCNKELRVEKEEENKVDLAMEVETAPKNLEFYIDEEDCHLIPVEFCEEVREISDMNGDFILDFVAEPDFMAPEGASPEEAKPENTVTNLDDSVQMQSDDEDTDAEASIGTEIPVYEQIGDIPSQQLNPDEEDDHVDTLEFRTVTNINKERFLETPRSLERSHSLNNSRFHLERRVSGTESQDSIECLEGVLTVDKLKLELEEERKVLNALYEELEEERSASAVAASETMAMINRLQEEKAAMQMEALQYQRMMEEQSEFDQEALQLLNELMVNREKENSKLEKELEMCRKRLEEYETKEKMGMSRRRMSDSSVDSDENNNGVSDWKYKEDEMENTPVDVVRSFDECLDDYEGERLSILGRLKFLEEKLTDLNNEEDEAKEGKTLENGNGHFHGKETNGKPRIIKSKRLLPLFDAVDGELQNGLSNGNHHENGSDDSEKEQIMMLEEEVDEVYERLEALEADREFLRHCVGSLKKGDKGVHLLHEILQHLRDLKNIDHVRENGDMSF